MDLCSSEAIRRSSSRDLVNRSQYPCQERREEIRLVLFTCACRCEDRRFRRQQLGKVVCQQGMQRLVCHPHLALPTCYEDREGRYFADESFPCPCRKPKSPLRPLSALAGPGVLAHLCMVWGDRRSQLAHWRADGRSNYRKRRSSGAHDREDAA